MSTADLVIDLLVVSEAELRDRVVSLEADVDSYRLLAQQALHALHHLTVNHDRLCERYRDLLDECRTLRRRRRQQVAA